VFFTGHWFWQLQHQSLSLRWALWHLASIRFWTTALA
jgi:hypothetical protein